MAKTQGVSSQIIVSIAFTFASNIQENITFTRYDSVILKYKPWATSRRRV